MNAAAILQLLELILPPLINAAETIFAAKASGPQKKAAVTAGAAPMLTAAGASPGDAPPELIGNAIEEQLAKMKAAGPVGIDIETGLPLAVPKAPPAPAPVVVPDPAVVAENSALEGQVATLSQQVAAHQSTIAAQQSTIQEHEATIEANTAEITKLKEPKPWPRTGATFSGGSDPARLD